MHWDWASLFAASWVTPSPFTRTETFHFTPGLLLSPTKSTASILPFKIHPLHHWSGGVSALLVGSTHQSCPLPGGPRAHPRLGRHFPLCPRSLSKRAGISAATEHRQSTRPSLRDTQLSAVTQERHGAFRVLNIASVGGSRRRTSC